MHKWCWIFVGLAFLLPLGSSAATMAEKLSGYILLQVQKNGEAWYVYPKDLKRYYLGRPSTAFELMRNKSIGVSNADLAKIPVSTSSATGDAAFRKKMSGYILLQVQKNGEAWYVYPKDQRRYYLGRPSDAFALMRKLGLGISNTDLYTIRSGSIGAVPGLAPTQKKVATARGIFTVNYVSFNRTDPGIKIYTDTGQDVDCTSDCTVLPLATYLDRHDAVAGIHGTYFCPSDYASCAGQINSYLYPVYNSFSGVMINNKRIKYTTQPMIAIDTNNQPHYYHQAIDFKNQTTFETTKGVKLQAAISNGPALLEAGVNVLKSSEMDTKQATVKSYRGAFGYKGDTMYLLVVHGATVTDSAAVVTTMGLDYAINLDGGGSTALYNAGDYVLGPGRNLPNAIIITK